MNGIVDILIDISNLKGYIYGPFVRSKIIPYRRKSISAPDVNEINVWFNSILSLKLFKEEIIIKNGGRIFDINVNDVFRAGEEDIKDDYKGKEEETEEDRSEIQNGSLGINSPKGVKLKMLCYPGNYDQTKTHFMVVLSRKLPFDFLENRILFHCPEDSLAIKKRMRFFDLVKNGKLFCASPIGINLIPIDVKNILIHGCSDSGNNSSSGSSRFGRASSFLFNSHNTSNINFNFNSNSSRSIPVPIQVPVPMPSSMSVADPEPEGGLKIEDVSIETIIDNCVNNEMIPTEKFTKKLLSYELGSRESNQLMEEVFKLKGVIIKYKVIEDGGIIKWCGHLIETKDEKDVILKMVAFHFFIRSMNENRYVPKFNYSAIKAKKAII